MRFDIFNLSTSTGDSAGGRSVPGMRRRSAFDPLSGGTAAVSAAALRV